MSKSDLLNGIFIKDIVNIIFDYFLAIIDLRDEIVKEFNIYENQILGLDDHDTYECGQYIDYFFYYRNIHIFLDTETCSRFTKMSFCKLNFPLTDGEIKIPNVCVIDFTNKYHDIHNSKNIKIKIHKIVDKEIYSIIYTDYMILKINNTKLK